LPMTRSAALFLPILAIGQSCRLAFLQKMHIVVRPVDFRLKPVEPDLMLMKSPVTGYLVMRSGKDCIFCMAYEASCPLQAIK